MNPFKCISILAKVATCALMLTGCGHKGEDSHAHAEGATDDDHSRAGEPGVAFSAKNGLLVPPATAKFIGLQVADVEERKVASTFRFTAMVYRAANEGHSASTQSCDPAIAYASGTIGSADAALFREGQPVTVEVAGVGTLAGRVRGLNSDLAKASGQVELLLAITDEQARLNQGVFVVATIPLGADRTVLSVPRPAILQTTEGNFVYTASGDRFVRAAVKLGVANHEFAEVADGLYAGDRVVVNPVMTLWMAELQSIRGGKACADGH